MITFDATAVSWIARQPKSTDLFRVAERPGGIQRAAGMTCICPRNRIAGFK